VDSERPSSAQAGNAVMQCGKVVGYVVEDEDGKVLLVDEQGRPVKQEHSHRRPVPPRLDDDGNPQWAV
jgi:hypothetical protein